jgi:hypothetical protein
MQPDLSRGKSESDYTPEETAKRAEDTIRRMFAAPHKPRKSIASDTPQARAQKMRRAKGSRKSR